MCSLIPNIRYNKYNNKYNEEEIKYDDYILLKKLLNTNKIWYLINLIKIDGCMNDIVSLYYSFYPMKNSYMSKIMDKKDIIDTYIKKYKICNNFFDIFLNLLIEINVNIDDKLLETVVKIIEESIPDNIEDIIDKMLIGGIYKVGKKNKSYTYVDLMVKRELGDNFINIKYHEMMIHYLQEDNNDENLIKDTIKLCNKIKQNIINSLLFFEGKKRKILNDIDEETGKYYDPILYDKIDKDDEKVKYIFQGDYVYIYNYETMYTMYKITNILKNPVTNEKMNINFIYYLFNLFV